MKRFFSLNKFRKTSENISRAISSFSVAERIVFYVFVWIFIITGVGVLWHINKSFLVEIPADGGSLTEGVIGAPRFINPLLAISDADRDLTALTYSGLLRAREDGTLVPDLAKEYSISDDGLVYTFVLKDNIYFHDGINVTADDVVFTVTKAQDSVLKSPKRASWEGVSVEKVSENEVKFVLKQPYSPFLENATIGILPKHIWKDVSSEQFSFSQFNVNPIGSGPYKVKSIKRNSSGIPEYYDLSPFKRYSLGKPHITDLRIRFYSNEKTMLSALKKGEISGVNAISPSAAKKLKGNGYNIINSSLPRVFGVFFNQNQAPVFADKSVRAALDKALDKKLIIDEVLDGYGVSIDGPIPPGSLGYLSDEDIGNKQSTATGTPKRIDAAREILKRNGWNYNEESGIFEKGKGNNMTQLEFSLSTSDIPELEAVGQQVKKQWEELGARVELKVFEAGDLNQNIIRPRKYDALLFGEIVGRDSDLFAFWHSSQRNDPGLNIALYANITTDKLLEETRTISDTAKRVEKYKEFQKEISKDKPAVFIYAPDFIYILPKNIKGVRIGLITTPSERFLNINEWFIETNKIWRIFAGD